MDSRAVAFVEVMAAIGIVGLVAFGIFLVSRQAVRTQPEIGARSSQWVELLLAAAAILVIAIVLIWQFSPWGAPVEGAANPRANTFLAVMLIIGAIGLLVFLIAMLVRRQDAPATKTRSAAASVTNPTSVAVTKPAAATDATETVTASHESPAAIRLLGLLGFGVAYLILNWSTVPHTHQYTMMLQLVYPAGLVVAMVMMFDKASRAWHVKQPGESVREWLFCNALLFLFVIGYLNLLQLSGTPDTYRAMFWDFLHVAGFLLVLWVVDRKTSRLRFLFAHAWLIALPILLLIWRYSQGVEAAETISWWETIWPFFFLALIFFVLELIVLIANREGAESSGQGAGTAKDIIFLILYVIILIAARPEAAT